MIWAQKMINDGRKIGTVGSVTGKSCSKFVFPLSVLCVQNHEQALSEMRKKKTEFLLNSGFVFSTEEVWCHMLSAVLYLNICLLLCTSFLVTIPLLAQPTFAGLPQILPTPMRHYHCIPSLWMVNPNWPATTKKCWAFVFFVSQGECLLCCSPSDANAPCGKY